jgi:hypothetical protein
MKEVSGTQAIHYRNYRRARDRALARLSKLYPNVYKKLLEEERENDETEGKTWVATNSRINVTVGVRTRSGRSTSKASNGTKRRRKARNNGRKK